MPLDTTPSPSIDQETGLVSVSSSPTIPTDTLRSGVEGGGTERVAEVCRLLFNLLVGVTLANGGGALVHDS